MRKRNAFGKEKGKKEITSLQMTEHEYSSKG
jgi:hypothetical protein